MSGFALVWSILAFDLAQSQYFVEAAVGAGGRVGIGGRVGGGPNFRLTSSLVNCQGLPRTPDAAEVLGARWRYASNLDLEAGSVRISWAAWMTRNFSFASSSLPGLRSGCHLSAGASEELASQQDNGATGPPPTHLIS